MSNVDDPMAGVESLHPPAPEGYQPPRAGTTAAEGAITPLAKPSGAPDPNLALFLAAARDPAVDVAKLERLMVLRKEVEADSNKRAFLDALARAKGEFSPIIKTRLVDYQHADGGGRTTYKYEELADITAVVDPILSKYGLSYRHRTAQGANGKVTVTCILSHSAGHEEENSLDGLEDKSGKKNPNQSIASTVTYLQRYSLKEALGIAAGRDDDGAGGDDDPLIAFDDVAYIEQLIRDTDSDLAKLLKTVNADSVETMRASQFKQAAWLLETVKRREKNKKAADDGSTHA